MTTKQKWTNLRRVLSVAGLALCLALPATAQQSPEPELNVQGEHIRRAYAQMLETLSQEVAAALPDIDSQMKQSFLQARAELDGLAAPVEGADPKAFQAYEAANAQAQAKVLAAARAVFQNAKALIESDAMDAKLMKIAILRHGTPAGLAEFAQQGEQHKALIDNLLADESLMRQVLHAGGANGGEYGEAMQVYQLILAASEKARERGTIFQNLALGTALQQPWLAGKDKGSVNGLVFSDNENPDGQVARYLHYENAYLNKELDPAFKDFSAWECRFITNDPYTNEELAWGREMMRKFRPDHITNPDHSWRYVGIVKSDVPYCSTRHDDSLGLPQQEALALGGICGRRAFFGRFITRAFGIPSRRSTQTGHAAMNMWTPDGWVVRLGAWWSINWDGPWGGLDFYLESQAREFPDQFTQVLRAQWIADALGEEDVSLRDYGRGGGFWNALAFYKKRTIVEDNQIAAVDTELASLTADEARLLGESDTIHGVDKSLKKIQIPEEDKKIVLAEDGTITVPAVACTSPENNTDKILFLQSYDQGMQIHYQRLGSQPEILRYDVQVPAAGKYEISALVSTVSPEGMDVTYRVNRRTIVETVLPYTKGQWQTSEPQVVELREGSNSVMITLRAPNRGVSIKAITFKPVK